MKDKYISSLLASKAKCHVYSSMEFFSLPLEEKTEILWEVEFLRLSQ